MADRQPNIHLFNESGCSIPLTKKTYQKLISVISEKENIRYNFIEVVYVDEAEIIRLNKEHLDRNYVTDIITFRYDDPSDKGGIEGTLFCCAPRIIEQAEELRESKEREFLRIYIHGLLHLIGYEDQSEEQKKQMTAKENKYLEHTR